MTGRRGRNGRRKGRSRTRGGYPLEKPPWLQGISQESWEKAVIESIRQKKLRNKQKIFSKMPEYERRYRKFARQVFNMSLEEIQERINEFDQMAKGIYEKSESENKKLDSIALSIARPNQAFYKQARKHLVQAIYLSQMEQYRHILEMVEHFHKRRTIEPKAISEFHRVIREYGMDEISGKKYLKNEIQLIRWANRYFVNLRKR